MQTFSDFTTDIYYLTIYIGIMLMIFVIFQILLIYVKNKKWQVNDFEKIEDLSYYDIAYLRGGSAAVASLATFELWRKGFLTPKNGQPELWQKVQLQSLILDMPQVERMWLTKFKDKESFFDLQNIFQQAAEDLEKTDLRQKLEQKEMLFDAQDRRNHQKVQRFMSSIAVLLFAERILAITFETTNLSYWSLGMMGIATFALVFYMMRKSAPHRTARGQHYLQDIQHLYTPQKEKIIEQIAQGEQWLTWYDLDYALLFGIYGKKLLKGNHLESKFPSLGTGSFFS